MESGEERGCQHVHCECTVEAGTDFCGPYCSNIEAHESDVGEPASSACACGHDACAAKHPKPHSGDSDESVISMGGGPGHQPDNS